MILLGANGAAERLLSTAGDMTLKNNTATVLAVLPLLTGTVFLCISLSINLFSPSPTSLSESYVLGQPALCSHRSTDTQGLTNL